jgi:hypothetical protein
MQDSASEFGVVNGLSEPYWYVSIKAVGKTSGLKPYVPTNPAETVNSSILLSSPLLTLTTHLDFTN